MNVAPIRLTAVLIAAGLVLTGCENVLPVVSSIAADTLAGTTGASNEDARIISIGVGTVVRVVATHQATERQRRVAEEHARLAYHNMLNRQRRPVKTTRLFAVDTERDHNSQGAKSVITVSMKGDKASVSPEVSDLSPAPRLGEPLKFNNNTYLYMGDGSSTNATLH